MELCVSVRENNDVLLGKWKPNIWEPKAPGKWKELKEKKSVIGRSTSQRPASGKPADERSTSREYTGIWSLGLGRRSSDEWPDRRELNSG